MLLAKMKLCLFLLLLAPAFAQTPHPVIRLYPGVAPGSEGWTQKEETLNEPTMGGVLIRNVVEPTLTLYSPEKPSGTAIIVCPGGAFQFLSWNNEGTAVAEWLNKLGVTVFLLKYRTSDTGATNHEFEQAMMAMFVSLTQDFKGMQAKLVPAAALAAEDGRRAMEVVRQNASHYGVAPDRIGIMGFSAGASVALDSTLQYTTASRPSFTASIYGPGMENKKVPADAPDIFMVCASDDPIVPPVSSSEVYTAWKTAGHTAELHIFTKGGHGFGMRKQGLPIDHWTNLFEQWARLEGFAGQALN
jgi:acetyl esterase/lipase